MNDQAITWASNHICFYTLQTKKKPTKVCHDFVLECWIQAAEATESDGYQTSFVSDNNKQKKQQQQHPHTNYDMECIVGL